MELEQAIELLKTTVKPTGTNDEKHIDLGLVSAEMRAKYERALVVSQLAVFEGKISKDELRRRLHLDS